MHHRLSQKEDLGNPILHLEISSGCESAGFHLQEPQAYRNSCGFQKMLEPSSILTFKPFEEHAIARYMVNSKIIQTLTYLKANRRIYGALHTIPKPPSSLILMVVTGSQWGKTCWPYRVQLLSNINIIIQLTSLVHSYTIEG